MATKRIVPRASGEGGIGRSDKLMGPSYFSDLGLGPNVRFLEASVTTTNATPTPLWESDALTTGQALVVFALIVGTDATGATVGSYLRKVSVRTPSAGPAILGTSDIVGSDDEIGATTMDVTAGISSGKLRLQVTGRASTTMTWRALIAAVYQR